MVEEEIQKGRENYKNLLIKKKKALEIQKRIGELEENPYVKEYLSLKEEANNTIKPNTNIIHCAFNDIAKKTKDKDKIYVYAGTSEYYGDIWYHYYDLETAQVYSFLEKEYKNFEKGNVVLYTFPELGRSIKAKADAYANAYWEIRKGYFEDLLTNSKDECIKRLIKKFKNNWKDN